MNNLVASIAKEVSADRPTEPSQVARYQFFSVPMAELSLAPLLVEDLENEIRDAFESNGKAYVKNPSLIENLGERAIVEVNLLVRMANPDSTYAPEWLLEAEEPTILSKISNREELVDEYREFLAETYELSGDLASELVEIIARILESYEVPILSHYSEDPSRPSGP